MAYTVRTTDNAGDNGRAADQNESVANDIEFNARTLALYGQLMGPNPPAGTGGMVRQWVKKTGIVDNTATEIFTITTTDEAGNNDGGVYYMVFEGIIVHVGGVAGDNAVLGLDWRFARAMRAAGTGQNSSAVNCDTGYVIAESEGGSTKGIATCVWTITETSEYVMSIKAQPNLDGSAVTTATIVGMVTLYYVGFTTAPVITSAE